MANNSKVVWSEGMFLKPQHFQQQDRYFEYINTNKPTALQPYDWGFSSLEIDEKLLGLGKFALLKCKGFFQDGARFDTPIEHESPMPLDIPIGVNNTLIYLTLVLSRPGSADVASLKNKDGDFRYWIKQHEVENNYENNEGDRISIQIQ